MAAHAEPQKSGWDQWWDWSLSSMGCLQKPSEGEGRTTVVVVSKPPDWDHGDVVLKSHATLLREEKSSCNQHIQQKDRANGPLAACNESGGTDSWSAAASADFTSQVRTPVAVPQEQPFKQEVRFASRL